MHEMLLKEFTIRRGALRNFRGNIHLFLQNFSCIHNSYSCAECRIELLNVFECRKWMAKPPQGSRFQLNVALNSIDVIFYAWRFLHWNVRVMLSMSWQSCSLGRQAPTLAESQRTRKVQTFTRRSMFECGFHVTIGKKSCKCSMWMAFKSKSLLKTLKWCSTNSMCAQKPDKNFSSSSAKNA